MKIIVTDQAVEAVLHECYHGTYDKKEQAQFVRQILEVAKSHMMIMQDDDEKVAGT